MSAQLRAAASDTRRPASARRLHSAMSSTPRRAAAAGDSVHARRVPSAGTRRAVRAVARIAPSSASASPGACRWGCARALASRVIVALTAPPDRTGEGCPEAWWMAAMPATSARAVAIDRPACTTRLSTNALTSAELAGMAGTPSANGPAGPRRPRAQVRPPRVPRPGGGPFQRGQRSIVAARGPGHEAGRVRGIDAGRQGRQLQARPAAQRVSGHPGLRVVVAIGRLPWWWGWLPA